MKQELTFLAPVKIGDTITARVEVSEIIYEKNRVRLRTTCTNHEGTVVLEGEALISPPKRPKAWLRPEGSMQSLEQKSFDS